MSRTSAPVNSALFEKMLRDFPEMADVTIRMDQVLRRIIDLADTDPRYTVEWGERLIDKIIASLRAPTSSVVERKALVNKALDEVDQELLHS